MEQTSTSPLDETAVKDFVTRLILAGETNINISRQVEKGFGVHTSPDSIRRFRQRHGLNIPGVEPSYTKIHGDTAECLTTPSQRIEADPDRMMRERGLDPADWYIDAIQVNEWNGMEAANIDPETKRRFNNIVKLYQTKFTAKRKQPYVGLMPARSDGWTAPPKKIYTGYPDSKLIVICGDQHAPYHDEKLHELFCLWLEDLQPDRGVVLGDLGDFPDISRHMPDPDNHVKAQACLQGAYDILRGYVSSSPNTKWDYLLGNHDERIRQYMIKNAPLLYPLHQVDTPDGPGADVLAMSHLLRLDELDVHLVEPGGTYEYAQIELSSNLAVRHGWVVRQGSGASALKTLQTTGYSVIVGHTHRQSCVYHTVQEIDGTPRVALGVEAGCMCRMDKRTGAQFGPGDHFPNYTVHPDWQQGFATAQIYDDGKFKVDLATYVNGVLMWRDLRYE